jgi:hypothetical protein
MTGSHTTLQILPSAPLLHPLEAAQGQASTQTPDARLLRAIYEKLYGPFTKKGKLERLAELAATLSREAGKEPPWTARYLNSILLGHKGFSVGGRLAQAMQALASRLESEVRDDG